MLDELLPSWCVLVLLEFLEYYGSTPIGRPRLGLGRLPGRL